MRKAKTTRPAPIKPTNARARKSGSKKAKGGSENRLEGEGSYSATRSYLTNLGRALLDKVAIKRGAKRARRAVEGSEGAALRAAEESARRGPQAAKRARAH